MQILSLNLTNFRNFSSKKIAFDKKLTVIVGKNGTGKSNLMEAVTMLAGIRPTKVETDLDLVKFGKEDAKIEGKVAIDGEIRDLTINFQVSGSKLAKSFYVDAYKKRLLDFVSVFSIVVFDPEDMDLVSGPPSLRRRHLDRFLSSLDSNYFRSAMAYVKVVVRRNKVLSRIFEGKSKPAELGFWDSRLLEHGKYISRAREEFFEFLNFVEEVNGTGPVNNNALALGHSLSRGQQSKVNLHETQVSQNSETAPLRATSPRIKQVSRNATREEISGFSWGLKQSLLSEEKLFKNRERDIAAGITLSGPHRDDFKFIFGGRDLEFFGSRGEQRMAVLALKLAELEYLKVKKGERPILALDDIFSELDWEHRDTVLSVIANQQTIITAAEKESIPKEIFKKARVVEI